MVAGHQRLRQVLGEAVGVGETPLLHVFVCLQHHTAVVFDQKRISGGQRQHFQENAKSELTGE